MSLKLEDSTLENISSLLDILSREVLSQNKGSEPVQNDLFYVLIIVLMLENGFLPVINDSEVKESVNSYDVQHLIPKKLETGLYEAKFVMFGCSDLPLKLIISPMGALMLINLVINDMNGETYSVCLPISRYVVSPRASSIPMIFRDLKHLSVTFKNKVLSAVKSKILSNYGYPSASLVGLPDEIILFNILPYLPARDVLNISETCKRLKAVASNDGLWREMYKRDYKDNTTVVTSWKTLYKEKYLLQDKTKNSSISIRNIQDHRSVTSFYPDERNIPFYIFPLRDVI
ncbi:PREDICTED: F-box only protein 7-like [Papilio polytes]|uniref:F-box only protein 7-like n=1 Tax=Papilio polytes TaxID=76194 RepID=UPI00067680FC|nr:PREDICTED: F-box only protein 7-like [Papilio polytes]